MPVLTFGCVSEEMLLSQGQVALWRQPPPEHAGHGSSCLFLRFPKKLVSLGQVALCRQPLSQHAGADVCWLFLGSCLEMLAAWQVALSRWPSNGTKRNEKGMRREQKSNKHIEFVFSSVCQVGCVFSLPNRSRVSPFRSGFLLFRSCSIPLWNALLALFVYRASPSASSSSSSFSFSFDYKL